MYADVFLPERDDKVKTLELPLGGSSSPIEALSLLIEFVAVAGTRKEDIKSIGQYKSDDDGTLTVDVLQNAHEVLSRMAGKSPGSLGLHPAIYFYNERLKYSRFLFLAIAGVFHDKIRTNNSLWFRQFTKSRQRLEAFLRENKALLVQMIANLSTAQRVTRMRALFETLVDTLKDDDAVFQVEWAIELMGLSGRVLHARQKTTTADISDDTKAAVYLRTVLDKLSPCWNCGGALDPNKSVSYHHKERVKDGGCGDMDNVVIVHPYCNSILN